MQCKTYGTGTIHDFWLVLPIYLIFTWTLTAQKTVSDDRYVFKEQSSRLTCWPVKSSSHDDVCRKANVIESSTNTSRMALMNLGNEIGYQSILVRRVRFLNWMFKGCFLCCIRYLYRSRWVQKFNFRAR